MAEYLCDCGALYREPGEVLACRARHDTAVPPITVLCGSTRFYDEFQAANYRLTMAGHIVLSVGFYPHAKAEHGHGEGVGHDSAEKAALDELHKRKIDLADRVLVLNVGGYIGASTRGEIEYARRIGRPIDYLEAVTPCSRCDGCGQLADTPAAEAWTSWTSLPPESQLAIRFGLVTPKPCDVCSGSGHRG